VAGPGRVYSGHSWDLQHGSSHGKNESATARNREIWGFQMGASRVIVVAGPYDLEFIRRMLLDGGYELIAWQPADGFEALIAQDDAGALVLSQRVRGVDCGALLARLRQAEADDRRLPVLLISDARSPISTLADAVRIGADQMLLRPIEPLLLLSKLEAMVAHGRVGPSGEPEVAGRQANRSKRRGTLPAPTTVESARGAAPAPPTSDSVQAACQTESLAEFVDRVRAKAALVREGSYFELLDLPRGASREEVFASYDKLIEIYDPGRVAEKLSADLIDTLSQVRGALEEAFVVLSDDDVRAAYARTL
jgi:CheY-like chemotaxis protein